MATLTVQGSGVTDVSIDSSAPTTNYETNVHIWVGESNTIAAVYRGLVKFDISSIPAGSTINSAVLTLTFVSDSSDNARTLSVYRVKRAWVVTQATWNIYSTGNNWTSAGCSDTTDDREATDIGTVAVPASPTLDTEYAITLTASQVQQMLTGGSFTNNGFLLKVDTENNDELDYYSTDDPATTKRPKLVVDYTEPAPGGFIFISS